MRQVRENKEQLSKLRDEVTRTLYGVAELTEGYRDAQLSPELSTVLEDLKNHLESIHDKCRKASQHTSWFKSWWKRDKIDREIKRLNELKKDCYEQFALFSAARIEGKADRLLDTTTRIENHAAEIMSTTSRTEMGTVGIADTTSRIEQTTDLLRVRALKNALEEWLEYPPNMKKRQDDTQELQHKGTGSWFLDSDQFKIWNERPGFLWIRGDSGTGKTVLRDKKAQYVKIMLQSIILQLSAQSQNLYSALERQYNSCKGQNLPTYENLLSILDELLDDFSHTYIVLDALDECNEPDRLVKFIGYLRHRTQTLHLLFTSQPRQVFTNSEVFRKSPLVVLTPKITHSDIGRFIDSELHQSQLSHLTHRMRIEEIVAKVLQKSNGMFRLAALLLIELRNAFNPDLDAILANLPDDLFGVYSRFLERIHPTAVFYVSAVLRWVTFSPEPVTMIRLEDALAFDFTNPLEFVYDPTRRDESADRVCKMLEGMIAVNNEYDNSERRQSRIVRLAHASVEDYLVSEKFSKEYMAYDLRNGPSHKFLAQTCLGYILYFADNSLTSETRLDYPLSKYAANHWYYHLHRNDDPALLSSLVLRLLEDGSSQYAALTEFMPPLLGSKAAHPLHLCCRLGYAEAVRFLLQRGASPNMRDKYLTVLQDASLNGHTNTVRILLDSGANVDAVALEHACIHWHSDIIRMLLQKAPISTLAAWVPNTLVRASETGPIEVVRVLLDSWTALNASQEVSFVNPVLAASKGGRTAILRLLVEKGFDVNTVDDTYGSALQAASSNGHIDNIRLLIEKGAQVNAVGGQFGTALQAASCCGNVEAVCVLLEQDADVNAGGGEAGSALQAASNWGTTETVRLLLNNGADVNAACGKFGCALQAAAHQGDPQTIQLLLQYGAKVNAVGGKYGTALQAAAYNGHIECVRILLENGAEVNAAGTLYGNALQAASCYGHVDTVRLLLDHGADVNATGGKYGTALQAASVRCKAASSYGRMATVRLLLENGADVNARGGQFGTALQAAEFYGHAAISQLLLENGATCCH
ncbi:HET-domain-containing protein [Mycena sanguinolenta]|uniref:HET-domain-containing protein n=1 Tax=Mycena sanguinolenta TaxID=230812 RepID=A0A8H6YZM8_9AGAR|nr:HET-domain-containing protein [Mycena sanguinolenta]